MNQTIAKQWRETHIKQTLEALNITRKDYQRFLILGNKIHRLQEKSCNGYTGRAPIYSGNEMINEYTDEMAMKELTPLEDKVEKLAKKLGLHVFFQTDPRGATIYLDTKKIPNNCEVIRVIKKELKTKCFHCGGKLYQGEFCIYGSSQKKWCSRDCMRKDRLEYLRKELKNERISYSEIAELQTLTKYIDPEDVELLQAVR